MTIHSGNAGNLDVNLQDQTTRAIIANFNQVSNSTTLSVAAVKLEYTITVTDTTGFEDGRYIILFDPLTLNFSFYTQIGAVAGNVVTLDTQLDFSYRAGTFVDTAITNMNVNGSVTPEVFGLRGTGAPPGVDLRVDITRLIFECTCSSAVALNLFGNLGALERGLVLRKRDSVIENIFNVKTNGEIAGIMYDWDPHEQLNPVQGIDGFVARLTFASQGKIGVAERLPIGDDLECVIQDDLQLLTSLKIIAEGHLVEER